ncbi:MAG: hypothetical protein R3211_02895 [Balneolaceae bacterium]|nr:hypothetical protein [Balneolaceae bacterium]
MNIQILPTPVIILIILSVIYPLQIFGQSSGARLVVKVENHVRVTSSKFSFPHFEPHLAINPTDSDNMLAASMAVPEEGKGHTIRIYATQDGGETWNHYPIDTTTVYGGDPWLDFGPDGTAYLVYLPGLIRRSADGGKSWSEPVYLPKGEAGPFDYPKIIVDKSSAEYKGRIYVVASQSDRPTQEENHVSPIAVLRSLDGGNTFSFPVHILPGAINYQNGKPAITSAGNLVVPFNEISKKRRVFLESPRLWITWSKNGGKSFDLPRLVAEDFIAFQPHLAADTAGQEFRDRIYAVWSTGSEFGFNLYSSHTDNNGITWSDTIRVNDGPAYDYTQRPSTAINKEGVLGLFWMDTRYDSTAKCFTPFFTATVDGGLSYIKNVPLSKSPSCNDTPSNNIAFSDSGTTIYDRWSRGGDYFGLAALPDGNFQVLWSDSKTGTFQLWTARITIRRE